MTKRMLIDSTHAEETRVVVLDGNRLEDFDVEASTKKQLKGNIYLAKVVRVEPSLQAAFVEYGGGRHGFLAFGEIHPDYYQIPVADRQRLLKMQEEEARAAEAEEDEEDEAAAAAEPAPQAQSGREGGREGGRDGGRGRRRRRGGPREAALEAQAAATAYGELDFGAITHGALEIDGIAEPVNEAGAENGGDNGAALASLEAAPADAGMEAYDQGPARPESDDNGNAELDEIESDEAPPEALGGSDDVFEGNGAEEAAERRMARFLRNYRIQEVIRRRQIMLIQVVKEERGTKGAALTTYISLAGRFCVLMPNSPRGGGISRKITSAADRRRLKEITAELEIPSGMGLIVRTAGANRPKPEIKRDCEYLMRLWDDIRELTLRSVAPALIYEEANLIKRAIRDGYSRDIDEVVVDGEAGWRAARDFMRMLMPSHARKVQLWRPEGAGQPLFSKHGVEDQLDSMLVPTVQLKSGGYLIINQAEALVAIDVNSGRSTRERGIEETALRTNLEAADEVARQLRLRDLAGLIVIDFIDMESRKHNAMVERRLKDALKHDRARIQVGSISHFGLLEMSRQRLRPSLTETSFVTCPHCAGLGLVRTTESAAIHVLRQIEEEGAKARAGHIMVHAASSVAMYLLNNKRERLAEIEQRYAMRVHFNADESLVPPHIRIDRLRPPLSEAERIALLPPAPVVPVPPPALEHDEDDLAEELPDVMEAEAPAPMPAPIAAPVAAPAAAPAAGEDDAEDERDEEEAGREAGATGEDAERRRRRRRRRRGGRREDGEESQASAADAPGEAAADAPAPWADTEQPEAALPVLVEAEPVAAEAVIDPAEQDQPTLDPEELDENGLPKARRRGRRGGRRRRRDEGAEGTADEAADAAPDAVPGATAPAAEPPPAPAPRPAPAYAGPTPADPFGSMPGDIFDILERAEMAEQAPPRRRAPAAPAPAPATEELAIPPVPADATPPADIVPPDVPEPIAPAAEPVAESPPVAAVAPEPPAPEVPVPEPVAPVAAEPAPAPDSAEPAIGPAIKPIVLGADPVPVTERKRGWWKR